MFELSIALFVFSSAMISFALILFIEYKEIRQNKINKKQQQLNVTPE